MKILRLLIEEHTTKSGKEITFKRIEDSEREKNPDSAWTVDRINAYVDGKEVGYLKISYVPEEKWHLHAPNLYAFLHRFSGESLFIPSELFPNTDRFEIPEKRSYDYTTYNEEQLRAFLQRVVFIFHIAPWSKEKEYVEQFDTRRELVNELYRIEQKLMKSSKGKRYLQMKNQLKNKPMVDFIRVDDDYKRQGIGEALYLEGAKWMKEKGMQLRSSTLQSPDAVASWKNLQRKYDVKSTRDRKRKFIRV